MHWLDKQTLTNIRRIPQMLLDIATLKSQVASLQAAIVASVGARVITSASSPQGVIDATVPTICLVSTPEGIQTYTNAGTGINGWQS
jgi:hypothetical protein